jgi:hypothetical protein
MKKTIIAGLFGALILPSVLAQSLTSGFAPITPCRQVDTRRGAGGGAITGAIQTMNVTGAAYPGINASENPCTAATGASDSATAVLVTFTMTQVASPADLRVAPAGTVPHDSFLNGVPGQNSANSTVIPVGPYFDHGGISVRSGGGSFHLLIDILGYFTSTNSSSSPILAGVNTGPGYGVEGVSATSYGLYGVQGSPTTLPASVSGGLLGSSAAGAGVSATSDSASSLFARTGGSGPAVAAGVFESVSGTCPTPDDCNVLIGRAGGSNVFRVNRAGTGYFDGGTQTGGADVAEYVSATGRWESGDVVEIDPSAPGRFRISARARSSTVAGVVSTRPGVTMNAAGAASGGAPRAPALALAGRVPVKVTAANGPIRPGDLLVSSSIRGRAMRAGRYARPGTVLGKSLGSLASGEGSVEMLVMLR